MKPTLMCLLVLVLFGGLGCKENSEVAVAPATTDTSAKVEEAPLPHFDARWMTPKTDRPPGRAK
jgi:hypothetical protein